MSGQSAPFVNGRPTGAGQLQRDPSGLPRAADAAAVGHPILEAWFLLLLARANAGVELLLGGMAELGVAVTTADAEGALDRLSRCKLVATVNKRRFDRPLTYRITRRGQTALADWAASLGQLAMAMERCAAP